MIRCFSTSKTPEKGEHIKPPGGLITYIVKKYVNYIEQIQVKAKEDYPKFYKIYRLFKDGMLMLCYTIFGIILHSFYNFNYCVTQKLLDEFTY